VPTELSMEERSSVLMSCKLLMVTRQDPLVVVVCTSLNVMGFDRSHCVVHTWQVQLYQADAVLVFWQLCIARWSAVLSFV
jgi:hypothetical protein